MFSFSLRPAHCAASPVYSACTRIEDMFFPGGKDCAELNFSWIQRITFPPISWVHFLAKLLAVSTGILTQFPAQSSSTFIQFGNLVLCSYLISKAVSYLHCTKVKQERCKVPPQEHILLCAQQYTRSLHISSRKDEKSGHHMSSHVNPQLLHVLNEAYFYTNSMEYYDSYCQLPLNSLGSL